MRRTDEIRLRHMLDATKEAVAFAQSKAPDHKPYTRKARQHLSIEPLTRWISLDDNPRSDMFPL